MSHQKKHHEHHDPTEPSNSHHEHDETPSKLKKISFIAMSILTVLLMSSYFIATFPLSGIIAGSSESKDILGNVIKAGNKTIIFNNNAHEKLKQIFIEEEGLEISICLMGNTDGEEYHVNQLFFPEIKQRSFNRVVFERCPSETIILMHTHPFKRCVASSTDLNTLKSFKKINPDVLMMVMCNLKSASVYY